MLQPLARHHRTLALFAFAAVATGVAGLAGDAHAQANWLRIGNPPNPPVFQGQVAACDSAHDRVLVYSPSTYVNGNPVGVAHIWEYRLNEPDSGWRQLPTLGSGPIGNVGASVVIDQPNDRMLLYGGYKPYGGPMTNELWALSLSGTPTWSVVPATTDTMRVRMDAFMCIDETTRRLVLYGGSALFSSGYAPTNDVWTLPLDSGPAVWTVVPVTNAPPPARNYAQRAWDPQRRRILEHGGFTYYGYSVRSDTWALSLDAPAHWDEIATTGLQVTRENGGAVVDAAGDRLVLGPGGSRTYPAPAAERKAFQLPLGPGGEWSEAPAADSFDVSAYNYSAVLDRVRHRMVTVSNLFTQSFALSDASGWRRLWPTDPLRAPEEMEGNLLVADPAHAAIWSAGGADKCGFGDLWRLDATGTAQWNWYPQPQALPYSGHAAALDAAGGRVLAVHILANPVQIHALTTDGVPSQSVWAPLDTFPPPRQDYSVVVDPVRERLIVFGGQYFGPHFYGISYNDVWSVPLADLSDWSPLEIAGPTPAARGSHFAFYDDRHDRMVMFGGWQQSGGPIRRYQHDAWALSLSGTPSWTKLDSLDWDPPVSGPITFDPVNRQLFLLHTADLGAPATTQVYLHGTRDDDGWVALTTTGDPPLTAKAIAFAPWCDRLVATSANRSGPQADETWALQVDHAVPALASLESVEASAERVSIAWRLAGAAGPVAISRRVDGGSWQALGLLLPDGEGRVSFEDRDVAPGAQIDYRLSDGARTLAEVAVSVPLRSLLSFAGSRPSPARGEARMVFTLPEASPVTLELFDVRGARVLSRELGVKAAGEHEWTWRETAALHPGLYLARLTGNAGRKEAKVVLLP